ncbi:hypothetical protein THIARS_50018 [Thiomonas delicata]|uniref:Uncharacterized protein n=1 Tax=Thiomonas delicata TaxID=364030 RepID=A0A238D0N2_THIDL|nr:hypothetical protein THIARS_50018 [Thiomonas delicata]
MLFELAHGRCKLPRRPPTDSVSSASLKVLSLNLEQPKDIRRQDNGFNTRNSGIVATGSSFNTVQIRRIGVG